MSNPFNTLNPMNAGMDNIRNAYQLIMQSKNPMQAFQQLAMQNTALQPAINMLNQGINPQQVFNAMCQQRGINPQEFLKRIIG